MSRYDIVNHTGHDAYYDIVLGFDQPDHHPPTFAAVIDGHGNARGNYDLLPAAVLVHAHGHYPDYGLGQYRLSPDDAKQGFFSCSIVGVNRMTVAEYKWTNP